MTLREKLIVLRDKAGISQMTAGSSARCVQAGGFSLGKRGCNAINGQAEGAGEDLRRIVGLAVQ